MKKLVFIIAAFFAVLQLPAQPSGKFTGALLWEISGNGLPAPSYIIGTHHLASVDFAQNIPGFNEALSSASQVVGEVVMEDMLSKLGHIMTLSMMPADTTYRDLLSEADYAELDRQLTSLFGAGLDQLGMLKPSMLSNVLSMMLYTESSPELGTMLQDPMSGIDGYVQRVASENGKPCIGLESTESQIDLLVSQPLKQQADELLCMIINMDYSREMVKKLNDSYFAADLVALYDLLDPSGNPCPISDEYEYQLNRKRNDNWLVRLPSLMSEASSFIAVGALHICGEEGLLFQLDKMGYTVAPVK